MIVLLDFSHGPSSVLLTQAIYGPKVHVKWCELLEVGDCSFMLLSEEVAPSGLKLPQLPVVAGAMVTMLQALSGYGVT